MLPAANVCDRLTVMELLPLGPLCPDTVVYVHCTEPLLTPVLKVTVTEVFGEPLVPPVITPLVADQVMVVQVVNIPGNE